MHRYSKLGPYYFVLDRVARLYQDRRVAPRVRVSVTLLMFLALAAVAWLGAEWLTLRAGEFPGSLGYVTLKYKYLMRLFCAESLLIAGTLIATAMAQRAAKIRDYR